MFDWDERFNLEAERWIIYYDVALNSLMQKLRNNNICDCQVFKFICVQFLATS